MAMEGVEARCHACVGIGCHQQPIHHGSEIRGKKGTRDRSCRSIGHWVTGWKRWLAGLPKALEEVLKLSVLALVEQAHIAAT
jgi:hypothetical protein